MADAGSPHPLSPHLQIWRWSITMASSITHRVGGVALYGGTILVTIWFCAAALGPKPYDLASKIVGSIPGLVILFGFCWVLIFHSLNGLRHLYWDTGRGLAKQTATMTAWLIYFTSIVIAGATFWFALS